MVSRWAFRRASERALMAELEFVLMVFETSAGTVVFLSFMVEER